MICGVIQLLSLPEVSLASILSASSFEVIQKLFSLLQLLLCCKDVERVCGHKEMFSSSPIGCLVKPGLGQAELWLQQRHVRLTIEKQLSKCHS